MYLQSQEMVGNIISKFILITGLREVSTNNSSVTFGDK